MNHIVSKDVWARFLFFLGFFGFFCFFFFGGKCIQVMKVTCLLYTHSRLSYVAFKTVLIKCNQCKGINWNYANPRDIIHYIKMGVKKRHYILREIKKKVHYFQKLDLQTTVNIQYAVSKFKWFILINNPKTLCKSN